MRSDNPVTIHSIHLAHNHLGWSKHFKPIHTLPSGSTVHFDALDSSNGQITPSSTSSSIYDIDVRLANPVFGPVYISDAEPGDVLQVEILDVRPANWGWTGIMPEFGLLADEFPDPVLKIWKIDEGEKYMLLREGVRVRKKPFLGIMGVAPGDEDGDELSVIPPRDIGGNMDSRSLTVGTTLYLPVRVPGALFSCGDGHAAQGDGEVCGTAVETPTNATLRFTVLKNHSWVTAPQFQTAPTLRYEKVEDLIEEDKGEYTTMGIDADLREATRKATRNMIAWLVHTKGLTREEAYILASVAGNLRQAQVVDMPNYTVEMAMPLSTFF